MLGLTIYEPFRVLAPRNDFLGWFIGPRFLTGFREEVINLPKVDVTEEEKAFRLTAELPGIKKEDIKLEVKDGILSISAEHAEEKTEERGEFRWRERRSGSFKRSFWLPENVNENLIEAKVEEGVLTVTLPKVEEVEPRRIEIQVN